jgi:hypothetical protein
MRKEKHGHAGTRKNGKWITFPSPTYVSWLGLRARLTASHTQHRYYTHVKVCERWSSFLNFLEDMGERPEGLTLDRVDTNGDYCKENCRWATWSQQNKNRRPFSKRTDRMLTFNGKTLNLARWANEIGISRSTLYTRIKRGMPIEKALQPISTLTTRRSIIHGATAK